MNSRNYKVFIQSNMKQRIGALISKYSLKVNSNRPQEFDVEIMLVEEIPQMMKFHGSKYQRGGHQDVWEKNDLQSFTMTRFLPPQLMGFQGRALVIDPDVFATPGADVMELFEREMKGKAIMACAAGSDKFKTSVMLLDCEKLRHWRWDETLEKLFSGQIDYRQWMNLQLEPRETIGVLEDEWNHCDVLNERTKLIHYTRRLTQPWKTGLKVDFKYDAGHSRFSFIPKAILNPLKMLLKKGSHHTRYQKNPDRNQEKFFFQLVQQAILDGAIKPEFLKSCVESRYVRSDFMAAIQQSQEA